MSAGIASRETLMEALAPLQSELQKRKDDIRVKEGEFDQLRAEFERRLRERGEALLRNIDARNPLIKDAENLMREIQDKFEEWERQTQRRAEGARFREGFNDSMLVFVFGKVKSGKSSLGNYVAWGSVEPTEAQKRASKIQPTYFTAAQTDVAGGDAEKEAEKKQAFRVGATEATSSIQGFRVPGLTWVDSPGLHSVNRKNGDLAKSYVDHADLIVYTMSSQAPGRASDMQELEILLSGRKKVMVLLTGSDATEEDEDENGELVAAIVMKPAADRKRQIEHVSAELSKLGRQGDILAEVLPISARYADAHPTAQGLAESGLARFCEAMQSICAGEGVRLKLDTPMNNLRASIDKTADDVEAIRDFSQKLMDGMRAQDLKLQQELGRLGFEGQNRMRKLVRAQFEGAARGDQEAALRQAIQELALEMSGEAFEAIGEMQKKSLAAAFDGSRLARLPEYREISEDREYSVIKSGNKKKTGFWGALAGGALGFVLGGPGGAALGASLGGGVGGAAGDSAQEERRKHSVVVGDNLHERQRMAMAEYADGFPELLKEHVNRLYAQIREANQKYISGLDEDVSGLKAKLAALTKVTP